MIRCRFEWIEQGMKYGSRTLMKADNLLVQEVGDEVMILDLDSEQYFALDEVGLRFWQLLDEVASFDAVIDRLGQEYDVDRERLAADMEIFVRTLIDKALLREGGTG